MNMEKYLANQSLPSYALNFDPTQKDLIRITDPDGHPMGKYIPVPSGASVDRQRNRTLCLPCSRRAP